MFITSSELTATPGKSGALGPLVAQMRDTLTAASGTNWAAWVAVTGRPYGTFMLSTTYENYADMIAGQMKIGASAEWAAMTPKAEGVLVQPALTRLTEVAVTGDRPGPKQFTLVTRAVIDRAAMMDALTWAQQVADHVLKVTGISTVVGTSAAGRMFEVSWLAGVDTPAELDTLNGITADAEYLGMLAEAGTKQLFEQGMSERALLVRMP